jgi:hypothetical protein
VLLGVYKDSAAQEKAAGVGQDGGAARGDVVLGQETDNVVEQIVDLLDGVKAGGLFAEKGGGKIGYFAAVELELGVLEAEAEAGVDDHESATLAVGEAERAASVVLAVGRGLEGQGRGFGLFMGGDDGLCHFGPLFVGDVETVGECGNTRIEMRRW